MVLALIILDLNRPFLSGFEVLTQLWTHPANSLIPIVIYTTSDAEADRRRAQELGASRFLTKLSSCQDLTKLVGRLE